MPDKTETTLGLLKVVLVALSAALVGGFSAAAYLNKNFVSADEFNRTQRDLITHKEEDRKLNQELRLKYVESYQAWIGNTLMGIAYRVGVQVQPPPMLGASQNGNGSDN